jgi:hypothetical protein
MSTTCENNKVSESETRARMMRGKVEEYDDDYIEKFIPASILQKLRCDEWTDSDGFQWAFRHVMATKLRSTGENVIIVAGNYLGHGCHLVKFIKPQSLSPNTIETINADELL